MACVPCTVSVTTARTDTAKGNLRPHPNRQNSRSRFVSPFCACFHDKNVFDPPSAGTPTQTPLIRFGTTHTGAQSTDCSRGVGISFRFISRREYSQLPVWVWYNVYSKFSLRVHSSHVSSTGFASFADVDPGSRPTTLLQPRCPRLTRSLLSCLGSYQRYDG